ncbi:helix-turn-helix domain-containing protein [Flavivirga spongiicola]|uniref:Helix-turn-helix domain-containing protein n=1 Tax=Flavivirga spongiicola TaxID=421621 RepID=A0ABU7XQ26_9FLAO|nr:helix-turn-helix domain-containing protein [Flavivirga sp. MEBiC05379]MDO5981621.1 helix-turn-helix domain-containing protein [Flavivirga sp. MEBiC05379]
MNNLNLAQRVKELRNRKGISQEILAEESSLSLRTIQRIENNETVPRGDTLKRLAIALNTSPDEIVDWKIQEDQNYLTLMSLSALAFLFFPLLGIIIPLTMWILKKDKLKNVNELGKSMLNFQISWTLLLFLYYIFIITGMFGFEGVLYIGILKMFLPLIILYAYNIIITIYNTIRVHNKKSFKYRPALRILR